MHRIITALPDRESKEVSAQSAPYSRPVVLHPHQHSECADKHTPHSPPESILEIRRNRPVLTAAIQQPEVAKTELSAKPTVEDKPKQTRGKHVSESDIRIAVKLFVDSMNTDSPLSQRQAEKAAGIPQGALSKGKGKEILDDCMRDVSRISPRIAVPTGIRRKAVEDATVYDDMR